jgi:hypothetical protein
VWISAVGTDAVALDAVGGRAVIVTRRAGGEIASGGAPVETPRTGVAAHPAHRMWVHAVCPGSAHAALYMAGIAAGGSVAFQATRRARARFDAVAGDEVAAVHPFAGDGVWFAYFDRQRLPLIVAIGAL